MTAFTKYEQWDHNYEFYLVDKVGKLGRFDHVGWRLLPPSISKSKEDWEKVANYFEKLNTEQEDYEICPDLLKHLDKRSVVSFDGYIKCYSGNSSKGLYSYDSYDFSSKERPYFRVTIPENELHFEDLPIDIQKILGRLRINEISFAESSIISEKLVAEL